MIRHRKRFVLFLLLTVVWMSVIFYKSHEPYQQQDMKPALTANIPVEWLERLLPEVEFVYDIELITYKEPYKMLEFLLRKAGHVFAFGLLAALIWQTLKATTLRFYPALLVSFLLALLYAASDEWHQSFVPNRTGHAIDVYTFDLAGIVLALLIPLLVHLLRKQKPPTFW